VTADKEGGIPDRDSSLGSLGLSVEDLEAVNLDRITLQRIHESYQTERDDLERAGTYVASTLRASPQVHSLKLRVKDPNSLLAKIVRKKREHPDLKISPETLQDHITDLVGVRALHLFKDDWHPIHELVLREWDLHERPIAYVREGDSAGRRNEFEQAGCEVHPHPSGYRSVHYLLKTSPGKRMRLVELQVRTIFEEGWSEIDHIVRYPKRCHPLLDHSLGLFNILAGSADEMGTFIRSLSAFTERRDEEIAQKEGRVERMIEELNIASAEKEALKREIARLRQASSALLEGSLGGGPIILGAIGRIPISGLQQSLASVSPAISLQKRCTLCNRMYSDTGSFTIGGDRCPDCRTKPLLGK